MIVVERRCDHHAEGTRAIVMFVIAGLIVPETWMPCPTCSKIAFVVRSFGRASGEAEEPPAVLQESR